MMIKKIRPGTIVLFAALLLIGACSGDSPTAPPPGSGGGGGGTPPPTSASVTLEVSNNSPLVNSTSTITATVTENGNPVPDGTAVEFQTNFGTFVVAQATQPTVVRTTTGGKATVTLTSTAAGQATVTARVNNVSKQTSVTFREQTTDPGDPGSPVASITTVTPSSGPPEGGTVVTLRGQNFEGPVRVMFGDREATVASVTSTEVRVISPTVTFDVGEETREVPISVIFEAGTSSETAVQAPTPFRYEVKFLTPQVIAVSPSSGPNEGGTVVSILGSGFQAPVRVFFGSGADEVEAEVQQVFFNQIIALTPKASGLGAALANQQVPVRVVNMMSGLEVITAPVFRYGPEMRITGFGPGVGPASGGTQVTIFGWGFDDPVAVSVGGFAAQPIRVSGTEIVVRTSPIPDPCAEESGIVTVTNLEDGTSAESEAQFTYVPISPVIVGVSPSVVTEGSNVFITVRNAPSGPVQFEIGDKTRIPSATTTNSAGDTVYTVSVPTSLTFPEEPCGSGGVSFTQDDFDVDLIIDGCDVPPLTGGLTVRPIDTTCRNEQPAVSVSPSSLTFPDRDITAGQSPAQTITVSNAGGGTLVVLSANSSDPVQFPVSGTFPASLEAGQSTNLSVTFDPATAGPHSATITISTSEGDVTVAVSGNGV